jgi:hypothetical protein
MDYIEVNTKARQRLRALVDSLTDEELSLPAGDGWTIAGLLAHIAFWDYRLFNLMQHWKKEGVGDSPIDIDNVNESTKPLCLAIPGREAGRLALSAAEAVDAELENIPNEMTPWINMLVQEGRLRLDRSHHRNEHLDQIDKVLAEFRK